MRRTSGAWAAPILVMLVGCPLAAHAQVPLELSSDGECPAPERLQSALGAGALLQPPGDDPRAWRLSLVVHADGELALTLRAPSGATVRRRLPVADCETLAAAVGLIVERQVEALAELESVDTTPADATERPPDEVTPETPPPAATGPFLRLDLAAGIRGVLDPDALLGSVQLGVGIAWPAGPRVMLAGFASTPWEVSANGEELSFVRAGGSLRLAWAFEPSSILSVAPRARLDVAALAVSADVPGASAVLRALVEAGVGLVVGLRPEPWLELFIAADGMFLLHRERYRVEPTGDVTGAPWLGLEAHGGAALRFL